MPRSEPTPTPTESPASSEAPGLGIDGREIIQDLAQQIADASVELATARTMLRQKDKQIAALQEQLVEKSATA